VIDDFFVSYKSQLVLSIGLLACSRKFEESLLQVTIEHKVGEQIYLFQFKKFTSPQEIPTNFLEKHVTLTGKVMSVEPSAGASPPLLLVDHHPVVGWQLRQSVTTCLPVHISSVDILNNGVSWLQHVVVGSNIRFTPLKANPESLSCIVRSHTVSILYGILQVRRGHCDY
jgi:hypothetical protein